MPDCLFRTADEVFALRTFVFGFTKASQRQVAIVELVLWPCSRKTRVEDSVDAEVLLLVQMIRAQILFDLNFYREKNDMEHFRRK